jgi:hypothetical protein
MLSLNFTDIFINLLLPPGFSGAFHEEEKCKMEKISFAANVASKGGEKMETTKIDYFISSRLRCESAESAIGSHYCCRVLTGRLMEDLMKASHSYDLLIQLKIHSVNGKNLCGVLN